MDDEAIARFENSHGGTRAYRSDCEDRDPYIQQKVGSVRHIANLDRQIGPGIPIPSLPEVVEEHFE